MTPPVWNIRLQGNDLIWQPTEKTPLWRKYKIDGPEPFYSFKRLGENFSREEVVRFAEQWGPLGICQHDRFLLHGAAYGWGGEGDPSFRPEAPEGNRINFNGKLDFWNNTPKTCSFRQITLNTETWFAEPLAAWENLSRAVQAILKLAADLLWSGVALQRRGELPKEAIKILEDLQLYGFGRARDHYRSLGEEPIEPTQREALMLLNDVLNDWLSGAPIRPYCNINSQTAKIRYDQIVDDRFGVFPVVATELSILIADASRIGWCADCKRPFPLAHRRKYCPDCGLKAAQKFASRKYRAKTT